MAPRVPSFAATTHAIPITVDEFAMAQRHYPVIFGSGFAAAPLMLVGLSEGRNLFMDADGRWQPGTYIPAYVPLPVPPRRSCTCRRRLSAARWLRRSVGRFRPGPGEPLFDGEQPTQATKNALSSARSSRKLGHAHQGVHGRTRENRAC